MPWMKCGGSWRSCRSARCSGSIWRCTRVTQAISRRGNERRGSAQELGSPLGLLRSRLCPAGTGPVIAGSRNLPDNSARSNRRHRRLPTPRPASATWPCMKAVSRTPFEFSSRAQPRTRRPRTPTGRPRSSRRLPMHASCEDRTARPSQPPSRRSRNSKAVKIRFLAARMLVEAGQVAKARPLIAGLAAEMQAEPQAYAKIVEGDACPEKWRPTPGDQSPDRGQRPLGYLDRPLRSRAGLSGSRRSSRKPTPSSIAASSAAARRCRCFWTRSPPTPICRPSITTRVVSVKG